MKIYKYKKIFSIFLLTSLLLLIVPITTLNTNASSKIDFSLSCDSVYKNRLFKRNHENERKEEIPNPWANPNAGHFMVRPK
jgi:hypothetical protein